MFHLTIKRVVPWAFMRLATRNLKPLLALCAPDLRHTVAGDHALGGTRHSKEALRAWLDRLFRLFPHLYFVPNDVLVEGPPWSTRVAVTWTDHGTTADGRSYDNDGVHLLRLRWGRVVELDVRLDTQKLARALDAMAAAGVDEATAEPIE